jgi:hypothetical protein
VRGRRGLLDETMKARIAEAITEARVEGHRRPARVRLRLLQRAPARRRLQRRRNRQPDSGITGAIRAGRPLEVKQKRIGRITACN